jgi:hypothetical protein
LLANSSQHASPSSACCSFCGTKNSKTHTPSHNNHITSDESIKPTIYIAPLSYQGLEQAITLRVASSQPPIRSTIADGPTTLIEKDSKKRSRDDDNDDQFYHHSSFVVYCQGRGSSGSNPGFSCAEDELYRTGRWNEEEVEYVDLLVSLFDQGLLPLADKTKLGQFLGDILLCKSSRLTKVRRKSNQHTRACMHINTSNVSHSHFRSSF